MEPPLKRLKKVLLADSSSNEGSDNEAGDVNSGGGVQDFKVNEEYARRFEYNKKREERQQCKRYSRPYHYGQDVDVY